MTISEVLHDSSSQFGHAGLALIGEFTRISGIDELGHKISKAKQPQITDGEILRTLCGLLCQGKTDFDHVKEFREDEFFQNVLGIKRVPSAKILRQGFQSLSLETGLEEQLPECSQRLWHNVGMQPEYIHYDQDCSWVRMDVDTVIYDNADTKKEGAEFTYNNQFGFHPIFAHFGGSWMVNVKLRPGNAHSNALGTRRFIAQSLAYGRSMIKEPLLVVADCGFDSQELIKDLIQADNTDFIIKHNLRRENKEDWLQTAKDHCREKFVPEKKKNQTVYRGSVYREIEGAKSPVRLVFEITETMSKNGQLLLTPEITVFVAWPPLDLQEKDVLKIYRDRGTSEQYHAEFKSEAVGLIKATRRRMKTVMRSVMFMCGKLTWHAKQWRLHLGCPRPWFEFFHQLFFRLRTA
ncbi:IS1380 family transposase [Desulfovermiculus halophilus]|uniref:IS1380 family transposase n=1 Tax=Desulfovermiculus halophilus TaxID=339722 RepID=UPI000487CB72|nr:IS1380 family transposase [Desulfovermiculus halophilus]